MANFNNLVFVDHAVMPNSIMAKYRFNNGKELSVVAGPGLYSNPGGLDSNEKVSKVEDVASFEVMFDGEVTGWQSREDINEIFKANQ
jgi:hypothetical protein